MDRKSLDTKLRALNGVRWVTLGALRGTEVISCIDGRHPGCTLGAPGGNAGELILLLSVMEWYTGRAFTRRQVRALLEHQVRALGRFYLHTDQHATAALAAHLGLDPATAGEWLRNPPESLREPLLEALAEPAHVGCGHLKLLLTHPDAYRVRPELVAHVIRGFHELLWAGEERLEPAVLEGDHHESALVVFHTTERVDAETPVPSWCPADESVFVNHIPALRYLRRELLGVLLNAAGADFASLDREDLLLEAERLAARHLDLTLGTLAPGLPRFRVRFGGGRVEVAA